jgi:hypothetical protein
MSAAPQVGQIISAIVALKATDANLRQPSVTVGEDGKAYQWKFFRAKSVSTVERGFYISYEPVKKVEVPHPSLPGWASWVWNPDGGMWGCVTLPTGEPRPFGVQRWAVIG